MAGNSNEVPELGGIINQTATEGKSRLEGLAGFRPIERPLTMLDRCQLAMGMFELNYSKSGEVPMHPRRFADRMSEYVAQVVRMEGEFEALLNLRRAAQAREQEAEAAEANVGEDSGV